MRLASSNIFRTHCLWFYINEFDFKVLVRYLWYRKYNF